MGTRFSPELVEELKLCDVWFLSGPTDADVERFVTLCRREGTPTPEFCQFVADVAGFVLGSFPPDIRNRLFLEIHGEFCIALAKAFERGLWWARKQILKEALQ